MPILKALTKGITSALGDRESDFDGAKVVGFIMVIIAAVGYFKQVAGYETWLYSGGGMILGKCLRENT